MVKALGTPSNVMIYKQHYYFKAPALLEKLKLEQPTMVAPDTSRREGAGSATPSNASLDTDRSGSVQTGQSVAAQYHLGKSGLSWSSAATIARIIPTQHSTAWLPSSVTPWSARRWRCSLACSRTMSSSSVRGRWPPVGVKGTWQTRRATSCCGTSWCCFSDRRGRWTVEGSDLAERRLNDSRGTTGHVE